MTDRDSSAHMRPLLDMTSDSSLPVASTTASPAASASVPNQNAAAESADPAPLPNNPRSESPVGVPRSPFAHSEAPSFFFLDSETDSNLDSQNGDTLLGHPHHPLHHSSHPHSQLHPLNHDGNAHAAPDMVMIAIEPGQAIPPPNHAVPRSLDSDGHGAASFAEESPLKYAEIRSVASSGENGETERLCRNTIAEHAVSPRSSSMMRSSKRLQNDVTSMMRMPGTRAMLVSRLLGTPKYFDSCRACVDEIRASRLGVGLGITAPFWIDIQAPEGQDFSYIEQLFSLHELTTEDCLDFDSSEKFENFPLQNYSFVVLTVQGLDEEIFDDGVSLHLILTPKACVTIHPRPIKALSTVVQSVLADFAHPSYVLYTFLDSFVDDCIPLSDAMLDECESIEELVFLLSESEHSDLLLRIGTVRKKLTILRRILTGKQKLATFLTSTKSLATPAMQFVPSSSDVVSMASVQGNGEVRNISKSLDAIPGTPSTQPEPHLSQETRLYLRDVLDHVNSCIQKIDTSREILNQAHSNYLARVSIAVAESSQATNNWMRRLGIVGTGCLPLTVVTSAFGMNVKVPFQEEQSITPFFSILAVTLFISICLTLVYVVRTVRQDRMESQRSLSRPDSHV
eukprot:ANDGO_07665.mRNA.1 Magnesium transporter ALR1